MFERITHSSSRISAQERDREEASETTLMQMVLWVAQELALMSAKRKVKLAMSYL